MPPTTVAPFPLPQLPSFDEGAAAAEREHQLRLTKPPGSLGRLEELAAWYAGVRGRFPVPVPGRAELFVFAADHGVAAEGVSAYPAAVTAAMVENFRRGGAAVNTLARVAGVEVTVVDVGVAGAGRVPRLSPAGGPTPDGADAPAGAGPGAAFVNARVRPGTANLLRQAAMEPAEAAAAMAVGVQMAAAAAERGAEILCGGDMGIGNTTSAAALVCAFGGGGPAEVVGRGTGVDDPALARKIEVVAAALARVRLQRADPLEVLAELGGLEIAALAGLMLGGAARRLAVVVDGFIAGAAALVAVRLAPALRPLRPFLLLSHLSAERGAARLAALLGGPPPLLDLGLRLGEGTGAVLAVPLLRAAVAAAREMATFESAAVPER
jgi:nicotinate-nucleotide--dimethylbenzimidazole phosphoribosyltransferase